MKLQPCKTPLGKYTEYKETPPAWHAKHMESSILRGQPYVGGNLFDAFIKHIRSTIKIVSILTHPMHEEFWDIILLISIIK